MTLCSSVIHRDTKIHKANIMWFSSFYKKKTWVDSSRCGAIHSCICWHWRCGHPKQAHRPAGLSVKETDWRRGPATCFLLIESAQAIWKDFEGIMRIQMASDFINVYSPLFISLYLYFSSLLFHSHLYWFFCIYSQPNVIVEQFSYTDSLINLKVFIISSSF